MTKISKSKQDMHDDISLMPFVIPGLTRNPVFLWIPASAGMTHFVAINVAMYSLVFGYWNLRFIWDLDFGICNFGKRSN